MIRETDEIRERVHFLYHKHDRTLTPEQVVADAKSASSPLHNLFEWDEEKAAWQHWLETAREIIRCVRVEVIFENKTISSIAYVHPPGQIAGYRHVNEIRTEKEVAAETLLAEFQHVADLLRRCKELAMVLGLEKQVDEMLRQVGAVREVVRVQSARLTRRPSPSNKTSRAERKGGG